MSNNNFTILTETPALIGEVRKYPELWDVSHENYKNRELRLTHWMVIAEKCVTNLPQILESESIELVAEKLQKRWKHIRDCYVRNKNSIVRYESGESTKRIRKYIYFDKLQFLDQPSYSQEEDPLKIDNKNLDSIIKASSSKEKNHKEEWEADEEEPLTKRKKIFIPNKSNNNSRIEMANNEPKVDITHLISKMICTDLLPTTLIEGAGFKGLLGKICPRYKIPSKRIINLRIDGMYEATRQRLKVILANAQYVSLSLDTWKYRNMQCCLSINAHFISDDWEPHSYNLGTEVMDENHTSTHILEKLEKILIEWEVADKLVAIVHDVEDLKHAFKQSMFSQTIIFCFAHSLQAIIDKALSGVDQIRDLLTKCTRLVSHFKNSTSAADSLREEQSKRDLSENKLLHSNKENWCTTFKMLNRLIQQKELLRLILEGEEETFLEDNDWEIIEDLVKILNPFDAATIMLKSISCPTLSVVQPIVRSIFTNYISSIDEFENHVVKLFKRVLEAEFKKRFAFLRDNTANIVDHATFFDPRYKNVLKSRQRKVILDSLKSQLQDTEDEDLERAEKKNTKTLDTSSAFCILFPETSEDASDVVDLYNSEPEIPKTNCPLNWWKCNQNKYPQLVSYAKKNFSIQATSTSIDKAFANPATANANRMLLKPKEISKVLFLNKNLSISN